MSTNQRTLSTAEVRPNPSLERPAGVSRSAQTLGVVKPLSLLGKCKWVLPNSFRCRGGRERSWWRIASRGSNLKIAYRTLFTFAGQPNGSRRNIYDAAVDEKLKHASELGDYAKLFTAAAEKLDGSPPEETDRVQIRLSNTLTEIRALREDLEHELSGKGAM